jgi:hypothetical protein
VFYRAPVSLFLSTRTEKQGSKLMKKGIPLSKMIVPPFIQKAGAMKTLCSFLVKFASVVSWSLSCFDQVLFKGHLPISRPFQMENLIDYALKMRRCEFFQEDRA